MRSISNLTIDILFRNLDEERGKNSLSLGLGEDEKMED